MKRCATSSFPSLDHAATDLSNRHAMFPLGNVSSHDTMFPMDEAAIGNNIRLIRQKTGLTVTQAAALADLTKSTLSKIETGQVSPPISTLVRIAKALGVELATFFIQHETRPAVAHTPAGRGRTLTRDGSKFGYAYEALALDMPGKLAEPFLLTINPGDPTGHFKHSGQEFIHMLAGRMTFTIASQTYNLARGDSLYFDATQPHHTQVLGQTPAKFICVFIDPPEHAAPTRTQAASTRPGRPLKKTTTTATTIPSHAKTSPSPVSTRRTTTAATTSLSNARRKGSTPS